MIPKSKVGRRRRWKNKRWLLEGDGDGDGDGGKVGGFFFQN